MRRFARSAFQLSQSQLLWPVGRGTGESAVTEAAPQFRLPDPADGLQWTGLLAGAATLAVVWVGWLGYSAWQTRRNHG